MDEETTKQGIEWSSYLIPIATCILGSGMVPKMEWISNIIKIWIFAFGAGLLIFSILITNTAQKWLNNKLAISRTWVISGIVIISLLIFIILGIILTINNKKHENVDELRATTNNLITEIIHFIAQSSSSSIPMPTLRGSKDSVEKILHEHWQQQVNASKLKDSMFTNNFHKKIVDVAYKFRQMDIISDDELKHILWVSQAEHPTIEWTLDALEKYNARLK